MDEYWTIQEAADALKVHERTIRRWIAAGRLAALRIARTVRIPRRAVEDLEREYTGKLTMDEFLASILEFQRTHKDMPMGTDSGTIVREWRDGEWDEL